MRRRRGLKRTYLYLRRANKLRVLLFIAAVFLTAVLVVMACYLFIQDIAQSGEMMKGTKIDGIPVAGLSRKQALDLVQNRVVAPLTQPLELYYGKHTYKLDPKSLGMSVDSEKMVEMAYWSGWRRNILDRMLRRFINRPVDVNIPVALKYNEDALRRFILSVADALDYPPKNAYIDMSKGHPVIEHSKNGLMLMQEETMNSISEALARDSRRVPLVVKSVRPEVADGDIKKIVVIKQSEHKLYIYDGEELEDTYAVSVGQPKYPTPNGKFYIIKKQKDPWWYPPKSEWAKEKKSVPPGPGNPLGPYWMDLGNGLGIHSTYDEASLGYSQSHGCVRMSEWGAMMLFKEVEEGTPVYIMPQ